MISPYKIKYAGIASNELNIPNLITCLAIDSDNGETTSFLNRESVASESHDGRYKRIHRLKYTETFSPKITLMKSDFSDFSIEDVRVVMKWITLKDTTALLEVYYDDSEVVSFASIGGFVEPQLHKLANNRTIAITATWDSISPFAFSDLYTVTKTISSATDNKIIIDIDTDDNHPVYPRITIKEKGIVVPIAAGTTFNIYSDMVPNTVYYNGTNYFWKSDAPALCTGSAEPNYGWPKVQRNTEYSTNDEIKEETVYYYTSDKKYRWIDPYTFKSSTTNPNLATTSVRIINKHYDFLGKLSNTSIMAVKNNGSTETIVVDGANKIISSSSVRRIFGDDLVNWQWLALYDGKNELTIEGNCDVTLEYRCVRKVGEY